MQAIAGPESAFDTPLLPTHSSHRCCHEPAEWGGAPKLSLPPGAGKPQVRNCQEHRASKVYGSHARNVCFHVVLS